MENKLQSLFPDLGSKINKVGFHKVALQVLKDEGTDYGNPDTLDLTTAISVLGTKLAMINSERKNIINGLMQLRELEEMDNG